MYLIFDDLKVIHNSPGDSLKQLLQLGYKDLNNLTQMSSNLGLNQILELLNRALISKSPLSDVFLALGDDESKPMCYFSPKTTVAKNAPTNCLTFGLKITMNKSKNEIIYAEADADFVDFLFSFLTTPIGSIIKTLDGNLSLGCLDNLCKSFESLNKSSLSCSGLSCSSLLQVATQFGCMKQPLNMQENHLYKTLLNLGFISTKHIFEKNQIPLFDPRSPNGRSESALGFVKRPSIFVVMDDLQVASCSSTSSILVLQKLNVPLADLVEHKLCIGETEALNLLGASLTSKAALTNALRHIFKKPKQEPKT